MSNDYQLRQRGIFVEVKNNDITRALRKMKKLLQSEGVPQELRKRECYEKPSTEKNRKKARAVKRWHKKQKELRQIYG